MIIECQSLLSSLNLTISQFPTNWLQRTIHNGLLVAIHWQGKHTILKSLFPEWMSRIVSDMLSSLIQFSRSSALTFGGPEVVVSKHTILRPFFIDSVNNLLFSLVFSIPQPIWPENTTSMSTVTTKTANFLLRKSQPSFVIDCIVNARCGNIRDNSWAESVISSIGPIHSLPVVLRIVKLLPVDFVAGSIDNESIVEWWVVGEVVEWGRGIGQHPYA